MAKIKEVVKLKTGYANFVNLKSAYEEAKENAGRMAMYRPTKSHRVAFERLCRGLYQPNDRKFYLLSGSYGTGKSHLCLMFANFLSRSSGDPGIKGFYENYEKLTPDTAKMLKVTDERFIMAKDFNLDDFMRHSFKVMHDELYTAKVRISPGWARWVGEKIWHESQKAKKNGDGSLELTFRVAGLGEIKRWILGFGPEVVVLEPERLKKLIHNDLAKTLGNNARASISQKILKEDRKIFNLLST